MVIFHLQQMIKLNKKLYLFFFKFDLSGLSSPGLALYTCHVYDHYIQTFQKILANQSQILYVASLGKGNKN